MMQRYLLPLAMLGCLVSVSAQARWGRTNSIGELRPPRYSPESTSPRLNDLILADSMGAPAIAYVPAKLFLSIERYDADDAWFSNQESLALKLEAVGMRPEGIQAVTMQVLKLSSSQISGKGKVAARVEEVEAGRVYRVRMSGHKDHIRPIVKRLREGSLEPYFQNTLLMGGLVSRRISYVANVEALRALNKKGLRCEPAASVTKLCKAKGERTLYVQGATCNWNSAIADIAANVFLEGAKSIEKTFTSPVCGSSEDATTELQPLIYAQIFSQEIEKERQEGESSRKGIVELPAVAWFRPEIIVNVSDQPGTLDLFGASPDGKAKSMRMPMRYDAKARTYLLYHRALMHSFKAPGAIARFILPPIEGENVRVNGWIVDRALVVAEKKQILVEMKLPLAELNGQPYVDFEIRSNKMAVKVRIDFEW